MNYLPKIMPNTKGIETPAIEAEGTGLAFITSGRESKESTFYTLAHINNGVLLVIDPESETNDIRVVQRWIEKVAVLIDWTADVDTISTQIVKGASDYKSMLQLKEAFENALIEAYHEVLELVEQQA